MYAMATHDQQTAERWRMQFSSTAACVSLVRHQVEKTLSEWGYVLDDIDRVVLVSSELATNAVLHGHIPGHLFEVALTSTDHTCLIEVSDSSPRTPMALRPTAEEEHGRGLPLVSALAVRVGYHARKPTGKTVWAHILRTSHGSR
ncbi:ATP-binding protein [Streptomyces scopuliridis]|uniref:ATP-binding protein n=1 Tax=Streptomyces scopuliridis TaxID=452529 RepID=A0ACD4ZNI7_9ACTN|nr:ATP-binding protein [Streptomyces scopuliridis]WSB99558.1 ATP-binding protein [Streptomyces scopuliridis]WSC06743.1 ATP-binding protein [Streptomyces scopuliridis]